MFSMHCKYNNVNKITWRSAQRFFIYFVMYSISLIPCNFLNDKPNWKYIYLPKLVSTEQFWRTIRTNTLLAEIRSQYKLWIFNIHHPSPICLLFSIERFSALLSISFIREQCFSCIHKDNCWYDDCVIEYRLISWFFKMNDFDWFVCIKY